MTRIARAEGTWVIDVIGSIEHMPGLFLGAEDVRSLSLYLSGCRRGRNDCGRNDDDSLLDEFRNWLIERGYVAKNEVTSAMGYETFIEMIDPSKCNVHTFVRLFRQFVTDVGLVWSTKRD